MNVKKIKFKESYIGLIPKDWDVVPLSSVINIHGGGTPKTFVNEYWDGDIPWLSIGDFNGKKVYKTQKSITKKGLESCSTKILKKDSLVISARGTVGAIVQLGVDMAFNQSCYGITAKYMTSNNFLYYLLKFNIGNIISKTHGSVFNTITRDTFNSILIGLPPIKIQESISKILSSLDDKIELNNKMSRTLEKIAQAIFKHWFIDFEFPDENGKPYKSSGGKMVDSEMGKIPEGWKVVMLENVVIRNKKAMRKKEEWENKKIIDLSVMPNFSMIINTFNEGKNFKTNIYELSEYDILFGSIRPYFGKAGFSPIKGAITGTVYSFKPNDDSLFSYILLNITNKNFIDYTIQYSRGTKMPIISWDDIIKYRILMPNNKTLINNFEKLVKPLIVQIKENILQNQTLSQLRDSLLPRLMAGKIKLY